MCDAHLMCVIQMTVEYKLFTFTVCNNNNYGHLVCMCMMTIGVCSVSSINL